MIQDSYGIIHCWIKQTSFYLLFEKMVLIQFEKKIKVFHSDDGGEFKLETLRRHLQENKTLLSLPVHTHLNMQVLLKKTSFHCRNRSHTAISLENPNEILEWKLSICCVSTKQVAIPCISWQQISIWIVIWKISWIEGFQKFWLLMFSLFASLSST